MNANAPKGGAARQMALGTFDNFNMVVDGVKGTLVFGIDLNYDTLLAPALDEVSSAYGLIAEAVSHPDDFSSASFQLRPQAKWHDGKSITVDDVIFSFQTFTILSPQVAAAYVHVVKVEQTGEREITFTFDGPGNRGLPGALGQLVVLSKHWWEGTDDSGKKRDIGSTTLEPPLGSGPYRIREFSAGRSIVYERVMDYWGASVNVNVGRDNFNELRVEYFRDASVALEAFKTDSFDWRIENSAKSWATAYDFSAIADKRVLLEEFPINNIAMMQAFAFNIRRAKFRDPRVRLAFNYAFDFEGMNKQIFFGQYKRIASYFEGTDLASSGLPRARARTAEHRARGGSREVFKKRTAIRSAAIRPRCVTIMREAIRLFRQAGYEARDQRLLDGKTGEPFTVEFLGNAPPFERIFLFYKPRLSAWVSPSRFARSTRRNTRAGCATGIPISWCLRWGNRCLPGNELRGVSGSQAADQPGADNVIGIKNPAVDAMIDQGHLREQRNEELVASARALDQNLLGVHYVVPQWGYGKIRTSGWGRFAIPSRCPNMAFLAFPTLWWWDATKRRRSEPGSPAAVRRHSVAPRLSSARCRTD